MERSQRNARTGRFLGSVAFFLCVLGGMLIPQAQAQQTDPNNNRTAFQAQQFRPWSDPYGMFQTLSGETMGQWKFVVGATFNYANTPLRILERKNGKDEPFADLIGHQLAADIVGGIGFTNWLDLVIQIPLTLYQVGGFPNDDVFGTDAGKSVSGFFLSDIKVALKWRFLTEKHHPVALGLQTWIGIPSAAGTGHLKGFNGEDTISFGLGLLFNKSFSVLNFGLNVGYRFLPKTQLLNIIVSHELYYSAALSISVAPRRFDLILDIAGAVNFESAQPRSAPLDVYVGGRIFPLNTQNLALNLGVGLPLTPGYGSPLFRVFFGLAYSPREVDTDGDGLLDHEDRCPTVPGPRENVGCPWPDTDGDGILDKDDRCPKVAGPKENQGCPWPDTDGDGLIDPEDKCPRQPGPKENQGCPWPDTDGDGIIDKDDRCPKEPGPKENQGCPWPDTDGDGLTDNIDKCPKEPGPKENQGCPIVIISKAKKRIFILRKIFFDFNKATIKPVSYPVLDAVVNILQTNPTIHVRIEGHTDNVGSKPYNLKLSDRRAASVRRYLVEKNITANRLTSKGYGMSKPLVGSFPKFTKEEQSQNRRVEFHITKQ